MGSRHPCGEAQVPARRRRLVIDHFQHALFCLLVLMWFGDRLEQMQIKQIKAVQRPLLLGLRRFKVLNFLPRVSKLVLLKRGKELSELCEYRNQVLVPLIRGRSKAKREQLNKFKEERNDGDWIVSSVDTLMDLELLEEDEMVSLCLEFLDAGTDTTSIAMQWIMANLVKYPEIQERLDDEIKSVVGQEAKQVKEEDLQGLYYLKAVVLGGAMPPPTGSLVTACSGERRGALGT
ncbi:cytochrome P450 89A2 [Eucalyptus grandis]|uniref:cytochrome P450 89A2 n=1 Tax=Eucalyptus grandis TaxID=71139 RepID=UPI00192EB68F|nr:cytochrome P450 89A2 [Eucalyptus grandis]